MSCFVLLTLSFVLCSLNQAASEVYYITTSSTHLCTVQPCLTLSQFAAHSMYHLHSITTLDFLPGTHYLNRVLMLSNVDKLVMKSGNSTAIVQCTSYSRLHVSQSRCIHIINLEFIGCGGNQVEHIEEFVVEDTEFNGQENNGTALELTETTAQIVNCIFVSNQRGSNKNSKNICLVSFTSIGGAIIATNSTVDIHQSKFEDNGAQCGGAILAEQNSVITLSSNVFINNTGQLGGVLYSDSSTITIEASKFYDNSGDEGGGVLWSESSNIIVEASEFRRNSAGYWGGVLHCESSTIIIREESEFCGSSARLGGVLYSSSSTIIIKASKFNNNSVIGKFEGAGGVLNSDSSTITIETSEFNNNSATQEGGVLYSRNSATTIGGSNFTKNVSPSGSGVLESYSSNITVEASKFYDNSGLYGGVLQSESSTIIVEASDFCGSIAWLGGVLYSSRSTIIIGASEFNNNSVPGKGAGGVLYSYSSTITIETSEFNNNSATREGGVLYSTKSTTTIGGSNFTNNVSPVGSVIYATDRSTIHNNYNSLLIHNNSADRYAVIYLSNSEFIGHHSDNGTTFSNNLGSLVALINSNITFNGYIKFMNNQPPQSASGDFQEGGAITLLQSNAYFNGACKLEHNHAENGGAIHSTESKLYVDGNVTISHNTAARNGGGVYLSTSELTCQQMSNFVVANNTASKGGGLHAISSSIVATSSFSSDLLYTGARINFIGNTANRGGGLSLEASAKLYILKTYSIPVDYYLNDNDTNTIMFTANSADYGGAVYVDDNTNSGTCASDTKTECFFQVLAIYSMIADSYYIKTQSMNFAQNFANISGSTLYGGLLDRCAVSQFAEVYLKYPVDIKDVGDGITYFRNVSFPTYYSYRLHEISISSLPVRVCPCVSNEPSCTHQSYTEAKKGETFTHSVVAIDQIGQLVSATVQISLHFTESGLAEGQLARKISAECTNLTFNVISPHDLENLTLYASDGPCKDADISSTTIKVHFLPCSCPIGLQVSGNNSTNCTCECHSDISKYMEQCDGHTGSLIKQPQSRVWISYINDTDLTGYLIYPNCPFDYCLSTSPSVYLNQPNGADAQCAFNRSSLLCGSCQPGLSLSLGSSRCLPCPSYWPALLIAITIAAILAGIALVALLLVLNMTVGVGTLNGLIFYANVVSANNSILLPFQETNFITVFISWLNLELGIDACYFPGMDTYIKTWLQLVFPAYVILLVVLVIIISSYSTRFSNLIGKKNPVATLATLILLSYAKLLEICFKSLSVGILEYPDGSSEMLWLPDATVKYLSGKHIPLFIAAVFILLVGLVYTAFLFLWQWLLYLPGWRIFRWSRNPKIQTFIETYHTPYTPKHRYWTGLLLIVRIILYLVASVNVSNDPTVALTAIIFTVCCLFALKQFFGSRLYRQWPVNVLETFFYLNILSFATFTWYSLDNPDSNEEATAYTSVILTFIILLLIILCHVYTYTTVFSKIQKTQFGRVIDRLLTETEQKTNPRQRRYSPPPDDDIHRFDELMDELDCPVYTDDYNTIPLLRPTPVQPTQSVVELPKPCDLAAPDPEELADT